VNSVLTALARHTRELEDGSAGHTAGHTHEVHAHDCRKLHDVARCRDGDCRGCILAVGGKVVGSPASSSSGVRVCNLSNKINTIFVDKS